MMHSPRRASLLSGCVTTAVALTTWAAQPYTPPDIGFKAHDGARPHPRVVEAQASPESGKPPKAPSDAVVLFDGTDLSKWQARDGKEPGFKLVDGHLVANGADVVTREKFGDVQLHVEWQIPAEESGKGQDRGNSGVKLMTQYEVQVLDSHGGANKTYSDGIAGAIYGQWPPLVNVARKPGEWQTYDIVWRAPRRDDAGEVVTPAYITVIHNGVLVQDHAEVLGNTSGPARGYKKHGDKESILLQWHGHPVRYRNIWVRPLDEPKAEPGTAADAAAEKQ
jgi:hypothetical protein